MDGTDDPDRAAVALSLQRALLGEVPPALRGVTCDWDEEEVRIRCCFDGPLYDADEASMEVVHTEVLADFPDRTVTLECTRHDAPRPLSEETLRTWVYARRER